MVAGGVLSWLVLLPLLSLLGQVITVPLPPIHPSMASNPATGAPYLLAEMSPGQIWSAYIRYIGAGAVLAAGVLTLARTLPTIVTSARSSLAAVGHASPGATVRTDRDVSMPTVLIGAVALALLLVLTPALPTYGNLVAAALVLVFGFFFSTVSARICGLIGSSSNPVSGMTIATLILTCVLFVALGWTGDIYSPIALSVGAIVCIAAANAGNTSQDLKTGFLLGATPFHQQMGLVIGVVVSAAATGWAMLYLHQIFGIGSEDFAAPQATLMSTIITGLPIRTFPGGWCSWASSCRLPWSSAASTPCRSRSVPTCPSRQRHPSSREGWSARSSSGKAAAGPVWMQEPCSARVSLQVARSAASSSPCSSAAAASALFRGLANSCPGSTTSRPSRTWQPASSSWRSPACSHVPQDGR
jgi:hypothetical protein